MVDRPGMPPATPENQVVEKCMAELVGSVCKGKNFKFHQTDLKAKEKKMMELKWSGLVDVKKITIQSIIPFHLHHSHLIFSSIISLTLP